MWKRVSTTFCKENVAKYKNICSSSVVRDESSWLSKLLVRRIEPTKEPHSSLLSDKEIIYALYTHNVKADRKPEYIVNYEKTVQSISGQKSLNVDLVGSWSVEVGDLDQFINLWRFKGGFSGVDKARQFLNDFPDYQSLRKERAKYLRARHLQFLLSFSYWPKIESRPGRNIYELRSYQLKPGTMIEWGNSWARAINYRTTNNEAFAGFFSQIGRLHNVHHIWCYKNLQSRKETRESAWQRHGWDECVAYTVPLIQKVQSKILLPTAFSPTK